MSIPLDIVYIAAGGPQSTAMMKARALERIGHRVTIVNLLECLPQNLWLRRLNNWTGFAAWQSRVARFVARSVGDRRFDVAWVDSGQATGPSVLRWLHAHAGRVVNYNHDDPTGARDGRAWQTFKRSIPHYDLLVTVRRETEAELKQLGAKRVMRVWRSYDEVEHRPREFSAEERAKWGSEVVFAGTWMPERGPFLAELLKRGLPLAIHGDFWPKAPEWPALRQAWRGPAVYGDDYARAIQCSKIALGLVSKGNRDRHTTRSAEIPAMEALFCAERTDEHMELFRDGVDAVLWNDGAECYTHCAELLGDVSQRETIRCNGRTRVFGLGLGHETVLGAVLATIHPAVTTSLTHA